jgi:hypothetical protein
MFHFAFMPSLGIMFPVSLRGIFVVVRTQSGGPQDGRDPPPNRGVSLADVLNVAEALSRGVNRVKRPLVHVAGVHGSGRVVLVQPLDSRSLWITVAVHGTTTLAYIQVDLIAFPHMRTVRAGDVISVEGELCEQVPHEYEVTPDWVSAVRPVWWRRVLQRSASGR